jgi:penicillin-binding protein 2
MGYVGEVDSAILRRSNNFYQLGDYVGRSGLEQYYEKELMGQRGTEFWIKDNKNRLVGRYQDKALDTPAIAGKNLNTYMDIELQQLAERLLSGKTGAIVCIDPKTGGVLAMASGPTYDPNSLTGPDKQSNYARLALDVSGPLLNRAIKGQYPPGSTYKPLGALIGLDEGVITPASGIDCRGFYYGCGEVRRCDEKVPGHAANLRLAIAHSCNSFFYNAFRLEVDDPVFHSPRIGLMKWKEYVNGFGLGHRLGIDLPSEDGGNIPDTTAYDKDYHRSWNSCTMVTIGIGQDKMQETPLQIANAMCIVANKGFYYTPHFVKDIEAAAEDDTLLSRFHEKHSAVSHISDEDYETVQSGMQGVTEIGTGQIARIPGINMCAKTGTAENKTVVDGKVIKLRTHSIFACFAPRENPRIAVAVIVENGGYGRDAAAPIASLLVEKYLNDTIATNRLQMEDEMTNKNTMPGYLVRRQFKADSSRAADWARQSGDSTRWIKYQTPSFRYMMLDTSYNSKSPLYVNLHKAPPYKSALAERLARIRAQQAAAQQQTVDSSKQNKIPDTGSAPAKSPQAIRPRPVDTAIKKSPPRTPVKEDSIHKDSTR